MLFLLYTCNMRHILLLDCCKCFIRQITFRWPHAVSRCQCTVALLGCRRFYLLYDGRDAQTVAHLNSLRPTVSVRHLHTPWASAQQAAAYEAHRRAAGGWAGGVGNYDLMAKQMYGATWALAQVRSDAAPLAPSNW